MNKKEKSLSLRIINELIKSYNKVNLTTPREASEETLVTTILTPSWLVKMKQDLIFGKFISLADLMAKVKATLLDSLRGMGPIVISLSRVFILEEILKMEVKKLPRSLKNDCNKAELNNYSSNQKSAKMGKKRHGNKKYFILQSGLLNSVIEEQEILQEDTISSITPTEVLTKDSSNLKETIKKGSTMSRLRKKLQPKQTNKKDDQNDSSKEKNKSFRNIGKSTNVLKKVPAKKGITTKKAVAAEIAETSTNGKSDSTRKRQPSRVKKMITLPSKIGRKNNSRAVENKETMKLGKRKAPFNNNNEPITNQLNNKTGLKATENPAMASDQPSRKRKRICNDNSQLQKGPNDAKTVTNKNTTSDLITINDPMLTPAKKSSRLLSTTSPVNTPIKLECTITSTEVVPEIIEVPTELGTAQNITESRCMASGNAKGALENKIPLDTTENVSTVIMHEVGKGKLSNQTLRKKPQSKFQQRGNQLMGIEEEEILDVESDNNGIATNACSHSNQELIKDNDLPAKLDPKSTDDIVDYESDHKYTQRGLRSTSKIQKSQADTLTKNHSMDKSNSLGAPLINKNEDDNPVILRVVRNQAHHRTKRNIMGLNDNVHDKDSDVKVEKVIFNETISDDDEQYQQSTVPFFQKNCREGANENCGKGQSSNEKTASSSSKSSVNMSALWSPIGKKRKLKVYGKKEGENTNLSTSKDEISAGELLDNDDVSMGNIKSNEIIKSEIKAEKWFNAELMTYENSLEELAHMPEIPEISCFLHLCQKALRLPFFTHFEFEHSLIIPHASCLMATVVTALLSGAPSSKETKTCSPLPYLQWNRKLTARLSHWFLIYKRLQQGCKVQDLIGIESSFWKILGSKRNPLSLKPFHQLPVCQRVIILKGLCDHLFHVSKRIQTALISTPSGGREEKMLGEDNKGIQYFYIPIFLRDGFGDLRIYSRDNTKFDLNIKEEPFQVSETSNESNGEHNLKKLENNQEDKSKNYSEISDNHHHLDKRFSLVADNVEKLNALVATVCSPFLDEELVETEKKLGQQEVEEEFIAKEEPFNQKYDVKQEDPVHTELHSSLDNYSPRNEHLFLATKLQSLAKYLTPIEDILDKSQTAALVKLYLEWTEFNKDGFSVTEKSGDSSEYHSGKWRGKRLKGARNGQQDENYEEPTNIKRGQESLPARKSLSRKAKSQAGKLMLEKDNKLRREIVEEMEEMALAGSSNLIEEEMKWDISLWADEDSDDDNESDEQLVEETIWYGYAALKKEVTQKTQNPNSKSINDENLVSSLDKRNCRTMKISTKKNSLAIGKKLKHNSSSCNSLQIDESISIKAEDSTDGQDEVKHPSEKQNGTGLNSYKIKIKKEDLDSYLDKNEPGLLIDLVRKKMDSSYEKNPLAKMNAMLPFKQHQSLNENSTVCLHAGELSENNADVIEIKEINPSQSFTKKILNSFKQNKDKLKSGSLALLAGECPAEQSTSLPVKVLQLKVPIIKEPGGKATLYSKEEMKKVTKLALNVFNELKRHNDSNVSPMTQMGTTLPDFKTCKEVNTKGMQIVKITELSNYDKTPDQSFVNDRSDFDTKKDQLVDDEESSSKKFSDENSVMSKSEHSDQEEVSLAHHSGFKRFPLKSFKAVGKNSHD